MSNLTLKEYSTAKSLPEEFLRSCGLSDSWDGVKIPYHNQDGTSAFVKTRHLLSREKGKTQFSYSKSKGLIPLGLNRLSQSLDTVYLLEGESDYFTLLYTNHNCLGIPGATNFQDKYVDYIKSYKQVIIVVHNDESGRRFESVIKKALSSYSTTFETISISFDEYGNDANDCWRKINDTPKFRELIAEKIRAASDTWPKEYTYDDDIISVDRNSISLIKTKATPTGIQRRPPTPVADFIVKICKQKVIFDFDGSVKSRVLIAKAQGDGWNLEFEITNAQLSTISSFQEVIEKQLGTKAKTYRRNAYYILKSVAMNLGSTNEETYLDTPGFQKDCYTHGSYRIDSKGIHRFPYRLLAKNDIASLDKMDFNTLIRSEAIATLRQYIENLELAYAPEAAVSGVVAPALAILCNSLLPNIKDVRLLLEYLADQGKGKTELNKHILSFFTDAPDDCDFNKTSDSIASIEETIHKFSSSGFMYNDFKGTAGTQSVRDVAERTQNWVDGLPYMRYRKDKVKSTKPFHGLVSCNGQDRLSAHLSSLASRAVTFEIANSGVRTSFDILVSLRSKLCGVTPHLIFEFFFTDEGQNFLTSKFKYHREHFSKILKAEFSVERMISIAALTNIALELMWKFAYNNDADSRLANHQATLQQVHLRQVSYVREADLISQLISSLIAGLKSGMIFLGKDRPSHCNASAVSVGRLPNFEDNRIWLNPQPLLSFIRGTKSSQEIASTTQSMITRELKSRGLLISSKSRATTRIEQGGDLGWFLKFGNLPSLEACLKELAGLFIPNDIGGDL